MNILFATGHPAQIHNFRVVREILLEHGHSVFWLASKKDISVDLLKKYGIEFVELARPSKGSWSKLLTLLKNTWITIKIIRKNHIDMVVSRLNPGVVLGAFLSRKSQIGMSDTEAAGIYDLMFAKLVSSFIASSSFQRTLRSDQIRISANIELFYLHPNHFHYKKEDVYYMLGIPVDTPYVVARFVSGNAFHDEGHNSFFDRMKEELVRAVSPYAKLFISSEGELPDALKPYQIRIPYERMHEVLAEAVLFFGEGASMASESALLGTPSIYVNDLWAGYTNDEERFGLLYSFKTDSASQSAAIDKAVELLKDADAKEKSQHNRSVYLKDKIDPSAFLVWFIENYPESKKIMKTNPNYQYSFR